MRHCVLAMIVLVGVGHLKADTLTFDDVPGGSIQNWVGDMPTYKGFNFSYTLDWVDVVGSSWNYGAHSGDFALLNNYGGVGVVVDAGGFDFTFDGLWAKQWGTAPNSGGIDTLFGTISGYKDGSLVWSTNTALNGSYKFFGPQSGLIDELRLGMGNHFLADDISLNMSPVPTPSSFAALAGMGAVGTIAAVRRRRKRK